MCVSSMGYHRINPRGRRLILLRNIGNVLKTLHFSARSGRLLGLCNDEVGAPKPSDSTRSVKEVRLGIDNTYASFYSPPWTGVGP